MKTKAKKKLVRVWVSCPIPSVKIYPEQIAQLTSESEERVKVDRIFLYQRSLTGEPILGCMLREVLIGTWTAMVNMHPLSMGSEPVEVGRVLEAGARMRCVVENCSDRIVVVSGVAVGWTERAP